jgi:hypothetical protein
MLLAGMSGGARNRSLSHSRSVLDPPRHDATRIPEPPVPDSRRSRFKEAKLMFHSSKSTRSIGLMIALVLLATASAPAADSWVRLAPNGQLAVERSATSEAPRVILRTCNQDALQLSVETPGVGLLAQKTDAGDFVTVTWPDAAPWGQIGGPALPVIRRLFIAPLDATVSLATAVGPVGTIDEATIGHPLLVMPRQAPIPKIEGARENAPFDYDPTAYAVNDDYLAEPATIDELGIVRGQRLFLLEVHPIAYNPVARQTWTSSSPAARPAPRSIRCPGWRRSCSTPTPTPSGGVAAGIT